ncbi:sugar ABC transporter ATP-binding protein [Glaesserella parasuis]|uniref:sugar ABC transporter ATP-binding protein n=1 Tax=Glaesserella parasuis TaxID=738 RepID=UPI001325A644|nr:sugar ABC transporter ATP-binding protein [Glaesserella parasuis]MCT8546456.1 sugar ABC transporter ATP-binding protein [Glaesserella parasuis]MCT8550615.1 sugar ABC transporter ATP-binding protein [Glaesserella parasuis]MCT8591597.1 sugar ABC transporter ATP-binding protein [Glaesserella parasuis]MDE3997138.1 sugar ABC transporter ATP-binding protein [Glaesserella parasuis]MDG6267482.1 sugar ABC transporter ATP-binding protein [Glaesserella parasuis]
MATQPILSLQHIIKRFGSHTAVNDVSLDIHSGEIVALLGENGAGKSTLIKILAGIYERDGGEILFHQQKVQSAISLEKGNKKPIAFIHQDLGLIEWMTIAENMAFVMGFPRKFGLIDWNKIREQAQQALDFVGIQLSADTRVFDLSRTEKALLAIARAIAINAEILVLDEPTASLPASDVEHLFTVLNRLRDQGVGMIYVTHRLDEVIAISDRILVMRDGFPVAEGATKNYDVKGLVKAIVGEESRGRQRVALPENTPEVLRLNNVIVGDTGPVSFTLHKGEMIALAGLRGAGQEEIGRLLFGLRELDKGEIFLDNKAYRADSPQDAIHKGVALVAGDRTRESLVMSMTTTENLFINPVLSGHSPLKQYSKREEWGESWFKFQLFDIRPKNLFIDVSALSGGNQQKIVVARWMHLNTPILILEDPTAGVDVGARAEIYDLLNKALGEGVAIIVISTDFEEIAHLCNRALVFNRGDIAGELRNEDVSFAKLLALASDSKSKQAV